MNYVMRDPIEPMAQTLFHATGVNGVYGRTAAFESVIEGLSALISRYRDRTRRFSVFRP